MSIINREKAIEEVKEVLEREEIITGELWAQTTLLVWDNKKIAWIKHQGKAEAYQNVLDMLTHNVRIQEG